MFASTGSASGGLPLLWIIMPRTSDPTSWAVRCALRIAQSYVWCLFEALCCLRHAEKVACKFSKPHEIAWGVLLAQPPHLLQILQAAVVHATDAGVLEKSVLVILNPGGLCCGAQCQLRCLEVVAGLNATKVILRQLCSNEPVRNGDRFTFHDLRAYYATMHKQTHGHLPDMHKNSAVAAQVYDRSREIKREAL